MEERHDHDDTDHDDDVGEENWTKKYVVAVNISTFDFGDTWSEVKGRPFYPRLPYEFNSYHEA